jgi:hypothetical protein
MSHSRNNNIISADDSDLDPTNYQLAEVNAPEYATPKLADTSKAIGFNTVTLTLSANTPTKLVGYDPARLRFLVNVSNNQDCVIGDNATVTANLGFNMTNHTSGGAIEFTTNEEVWINYLNTGGSSSATITVWVFIERSANN